MNKDEALKMAIKALDEYPVSTGKLRIALEACKEALEQPAQEPVAYILRNEYNEYRLEPLDSLKITDFPVEVEIKLYTHPHQWQGLTDDEAKKIIAEFEPLYDGYGMLCTIEQALKEKNYP